MAGGRQRKAHDLRTLVDDFAFAHPGRTALIIAGLLVAGLLEGLTVVSALPVLTLGSSSGSSGASVLGRLVDSSLSQIGLEASVRNLVLLMVICLTAKAALMLASMQLAGNGVAEVTTGLRRRMIAALMGARWSFYVSEPVGAFANSFAVEAQAGGRAYEALCRIASLAVQACIYLAIAVTFSWAAALAAMAAGAALVLMLSTLVKKARRVGHAQSRQMVALSSEIGDRLGGFKPLRAMAQESRIAADLSAIVTDLDTSARQAFRYQRMLHHLAEPLIFIFLAAGMLAAYGLWTMPMSHQIVLGALFFRLITRIGSIQQEWQNIALLEGSYLSFKDRLRRAEQARETFSGRSLPPLPAPIVLDQVAFTHEESATDGAVLKCATLRINPRELTILIGPSGAGKTTIADLILGLREPQSGAITIGGTRLSQIDMLAWRRRVGYVPQELTLFNRSMRDNITLDDDSISDAQVVAALQQAGAWEFVKRMPAGLDTGLGQGGAKLSGGQRQRIAIARALVRNPALLILDEPTSSLDRTAEGEICKTVWSLARSRSVLVITHQAAWLSVADQVCRLENGRVTSDTPVALVANAPPPASKRLVPAIAAE